MTTDIAYTSGFAAQPALSCVGENEIQPVHVETETDMEVDGGGSSVAVVAAASDADDEAKEAAFVMKVVALVMSGVLLFPTFLRLGTALGLM